MTTLLRDVIDIPERVGADDYVLRLTDSTDDDQHIRATLDQYVVTGSLRENFVSAINLVSDALTKTTSRAAYLTGSFGSGKSHFMAVLYALLGNHPAMRTPKFGDLTGHYDGQLSGKKILRLTYHLLGATSLEQAILRGYVQQIIRLHPDAPLPAVHLSDTLLTDAEHLRERMGDEEFLAGLGAASDSGDGWGGLLGAGWDLPRYQAAVQASPEDPERRELVSALANSYFKAFTETADYIDLDRGLVVISEHAQALGYDAVVLFLDELVLWLAFSVRDNEFFARESQKITKLVESSGRQRAIPLISFVSRQMDLRKWFADAGASGAEQEALDRAFQYQQGRFQEIELGDDNLAEVAHARLLKPKDDAARALLDQAFANLSRNPEVWDVLRDSLNTDDRHRGASEAEFRLTYPFSPVLISTLRNLSSVMQRERTALKIMQRMLVARRDTLTIDDLIPVGDAFPYIVEGGEPIDSHAGALFKAASELYENRLLPSLLEKHSVTTEQLDTDPASVPPGFRGQDRIAKTLLLSAIAPNVPALRDITASRLAALNHGSIRARIAGGEARLTLGIVREWAQKDIPEISVSDAANPVIRVQLANVDYQSILDRVRAEDNSGRRKVLLRTLIHRALGVGSGQDDLGGAASRSLIWRGSRREVDIVFGNVRDASSLPEQYFDNRPGTWRVVVDYPFDEAGYTSADDISRVDRLLTTGDRHTVVWLPRFFTTAAMEDLALLVKLDWLFTGTGDRWTENSDHLSATDRAQARGILENLLSGTRTSVENLLKQAYGIEPPDPKRTTTKSMQFDVLTSLSRDFDPQMPPAASLEDALVNIVSQAYAATYPSHPEFDPPAEEVTVRNFEIVRDYVEKASTHRDGRVPTNPGNDRKLIRRVAGPLRVGKATEDHFLFGEDSFAYWAGELDRAVQAATPLTVGALQQHIESLCPAWGLRPEARDLIISAWALLRKRAWFEAGIMITPPALGRLRPSIELRAEELPAQQEWDDARTNASKLFGYTIPRTYLTGANVAEFATQVRAKAGEAAGELEYLVEELDSAHTRLGTEAGPDDRLAAARALQGFAEKLRNTAGNVALIEAMAGVELPLALETAAQIRSDAARDTRSLRNFRWKLLHALHRATDRPGDAGDEARAIEKRLQEAIAIPGRALSEELTTTENTLVAWVVTDEPKPSGKSVLANTDDIKSLTAALTDVVTKERRDNSRALVGGMSTLVATEPIIRARLKKAHDKHYRGGVLGLRAAPVWDGSPFKYDGKPVTVVACPSVLAIWEAIDARADGQWTVVLTSVDDNELGDTVLAHLLDGRLITPDPWDALRGNFSASTIEPALYRSTNDRAIANGLLAVLSAGGYSPAPSGVLTQDHAMSAVARDVFKIVKDPDVEIDALAVLEWSRSEHAAEDLVRLRGAGGTELAEAFSTWLAGRIGRLARPFAALWQRQRIGELVPLGVVAGLFCDAGSSDSVSLGIFLGRYGLHGLTLEDLSCWYADASGLVTNSLEARQQRTVLDAATTVVNELGIAAAASYSRLLPHGLEARLAALADAATDAVPHPLPEDLTAPLITNTDLQRIEKQWADVQTHFLAEGSPTCRAFTGAVRLVRWLAEPAAPTKGLAAAVEDYLRNTSWVDTALVTARRGAENRIPAAALRTIIDAASTRRASGDRIFAAALADAPTPAVPTVETVLADTVIPLARTVPTLLVVVDALSLAAANDLVAAAQREGWIEVSATADTRRGAALAVLPTLTQRSRCSLLCGELREGADPVERAGFVSLIRNAHLQPTGGVPAPIFHKNALDAVPAGLSLATDVNNAIADTANQKLVAVVLNYVDDTLHHTDPGGTDWNLDTITHLRPLLYAARNAGRTVVITSDHGHLIEYGNSAKVDRANTYGQRAHGDFANVDPDREIIIEGPRVLAEDNRVVLAVDDTVRYGARNAGYHGGASPAEVIVPVVLLTVGRVPDTMVPVAGAEPPWWHAGVVRGEVDAPSVIRPRKKHQPQEATLFDDSADRAPNALPDNVIRTAVFAEQFKLAGRIVVKQDQIKNLLHVLLAAGGHEITLAQAAAALKVATASINGALMQTKRVLDVEGYEVLRVDRGVVRLDVSALTEQFGVTP